VAVDQNQNVYIADSWNQRVRRVSAGVISTVAGNGRADSWGRGAYGGDGGPATSASLNWPTAVTVDGAGNLFIADTYNQRIRRVDAGTGTITTVAGNGTIGDSGDGGPAVDAQLNFPYGVVVAPDGTLFIADSMNHRIRAVKDGIISPVAGDGNRGLAGDNGAPSAAEFNEPRGLALTDTGDLLVADTGNNRVRMVILGDTGTVSGKVLDAQTQLPIPGAQVSWNGVMAIADNVGGYTLMARAGGVTIRAGAPTYGAVTDSVAVAAGETSPHDFLLPSGTVLGRVVDDGGHVVAGASVTTDGDAIVSGADGSFQLRMAPGQHIVRAVKDGYGAASQTANVLASQTATLLLTLPRLHSTGLTLTYDHDWISPHENPGDYNTPSSDWAFAGEQLPASRTVFSIPSGATTSVDFLFPDKTDGVNNVMAVNGQTLPVPAGHYAGVHLLEASQYGAWDGAVTLNYSDGTAAIPMHWSDWAWNAVGQQLGANETVAIPTDHRHKAGQPSGSPPVDILHSFAAADSSRTLVSITLPADTGGAGSKDAYIFAISLDATGGAPPYGDVDGDRSILMPDARMALETAAGLRSLSPEEATRADLSPAYPDGSFGDGQIGMDDALAILRVVGH
jgi:hypothetical protein